MTVYQVVFYSMPDSKEGGPINSLMSPHFWKHLHKHSVDIHVATVYKIKQQKPSLVQSSFFFSSDDREEKYVYTNRHTSTHQNKFCKTKLIKYLG